ncbi:MAG TPA: amidohydrolase family protein [Nevskiaceae bacterium]|nr:amidohydrolase family protein [Nevskiaceae bacterium]
MTTEAKAATVIKASADDARRYWLDEGRSVGGVIRQIDHAAYIQGVHPLFEGIRIVDCDTHFTEPPDLFTANAPAGLKGKLPHVRRIDGADRWFIGDKDFGSIGGNVIAADRNKLLGRLAFQNYDQIHAGSYQIEARLKEMDAIGVWAHICYQNGGLTQAGSLVALGDDELALTIVRMFNDACADRMKASGGRINCMATLPYWDQKAMVAEMRRIIDLGLKGVVMPDRPERLVEGYLGADGKVSPYWEAIFDLSNATGMPLTFHLNHSLDADSAIWNNLGFDQRLPIHAMLHSVGTSATMSNFMVSGLLDKYTALKIGLIESGAGWVPFVLEAMEHQLAEFRTAENRGLKRRPKEYFAKHFWVTFWFETYAPKHMLDAIGVDRVLFETDFPHPTSLYPGVQEKLVATLGGYDHDTRKRVLERNACELHNLSF